MRNRCFVVDRNRVDTLEGYIDIDNVKGFDFRPQNKVKYEGVEVGHLTVSSPELIKKVLIRKTKRKLNMYLNYLLNYVSSEDDGDGLELVIDDVQRFKTLIINKYSKFLGKRYIASLLKKVRFVEKELVSKLKELSFENEKETKRRR
ncbi:MAG: hypothetical protein IKF01_03255 [Bacilli bacterium]|nr:hypothetical protein [Bacilli bacterium]